ncbi:uncharacterized protein LOC129870978 [Solanum dulcamara]|uniref:uncharacterized protein LOC129870978 n=1 Tax=Solanum dulcamara TaxID=45834 RepID=UPI002485FEDB|nr:uncharacterized protein LOC129870978 [Solanum dulcamara]
MSSNVAVKKDEPGAFNIPCTIGLYQFAKALYGLGTCINLIPCAIFKPLGLGEPKPTIVQLLMVDRSIKRLTSIRYDILVKVYKFIFLANFVILYCEIDADVPIILDWTFLATSRALVDVESGELKF